MKHYKIKFAGEIFEILPSGTIFWPSEQILIASDLHLEKGSSFNHKGTFLPPYDSLDTISRLEEIIKKTSPKKVLLLGDTIHDKNGLLRMSDEVKENFFSLFKKSSLIFISGNHDEELLSNNLELIPFYKLKNIVIGFGITKKTIRSLKSADGLVVGSAICNEISKSLKNRLNPVTNATKMVSLLKNKIS